MHEGIEADIFWNLPALGDYRPGTELPCSINVVNLTARERLFLVMARTFDGGGRQISEQPVPVNGLAWFVVDGQDRQTLAGSLILEESDVTLGVFLVEQESQAVGDQGYTFLRGY